MNSDVMVDDAMSRATVRGTGSGRQKRETGHPEVSLDRTRWQPIFVRYFSTWRPPTDIFYADNRLVILMEIAGLRENDFEVVLHSHLLTVSGTRQQIAQISNGAYQQMEIQRGVFRAEIQIPWKVQRDQVTALYRDGLLRIELPQAEPRMIRLSINPTDENRYD